MAKRQIKLNDLIFKKDSKELTAGAKIGATALAAGAALLLSRSKASKEKRESAQAQQEIPAQPQTTPPPTNQQEEQKPKSSKNMLYIGLGVGALLIVGAVFFISKKKV